MWRRGVLFSHCTVSGYYRCFQGITYEDAVSGERPVLPAPAFRCDFQACRGFRIVGRRGVKNSVLPVSASGCVFHASGGFRGRPLMRNPLDVRVRSSRCTGLGSIPVHPEGSVPRKPCTQGVSCRIGARNPLLARKGPRNRAPGGAAYVYAAIPFLRLHGKRLESVHPGVFALWKPVPRVPRFPRIRTRRGSPSGAGGAPLPLSRTSGVPARWPQSSRPAHGLHSSRIRACPDVAFRWWFGVVGVFRIEWAELFYGGRTSFPPFT